MRNPVRSALGAALAIAALAVLPAAGAYAAPAPNRGPTTGGTVTTVPAPPQEVTFTSVSAGGDFSVTLGSDGNTYAWGENSAGQLGNGTTTPSDTPIRVQAPEGVSFTSLSASAAYVLAIGSDGLTYAWGSNTYQQLGDGSGENQSVPVPVALPPGVTFTSVFTGQDVSFGMGSDGRLYGWGYNANGAVGDGTELGAGQDDRRPVPVPVKTPDGVTFTSVETGAGHAIATGSDGKFYTWGLNGQGQLGDGTELDRSTPFPLQAPPGVTFTDVFAGPLRSYAIAANGEVYAWGFNVTGALGDGTTNRTAVPVRVVMPTGVTFESIVSGEYHTIAFGSDGNMYSWGMGAFGQLGNGSTEGSLIPTLMPTPEGVSFTSVSAGWGHSVARGSDGRFYSWGYNSTAQLGDGTLENRLTPGAVNDPHGVITSVTFDGLEGTALTDAEDGSWSVVSPAHDAGPVDVVVSWTLGGVAQAPITYVDGFTYDPVGVTPTISNPESATVSEGHKAIFTVTATGAPAPVVTWEYSVDGGATWASAAELSGAAVSSDGWELTVSGATALDGAQFRATATNSEGAARSDPATLTVKSGSDPGENEPGDGADGEVTPGSGDTGRVDLANTGAGDAAPLLPGALGALMLGGLAVTLGLARERNVLKR